MMFDRFSPEAIRQGRSLLRKMLAELGVDGSEPGAMTARTPLARRMLPHLGADKFDALIVQRVPGGWSADLLLKDMPEGCGDVMGIPDSHPVATYEQAMAVGRRMVRGLLDR